MTEKEPIVWPASTEPFRWIRVVIFGGEKLVSIPIRNVAVRNGESFTISFEANPGTAE